MIVVSGCPRSGTSLTMLLLRKALGEDRIIGTEFPQEKRILSMLSASPNESLVEYENRKDLFEIQQPNWRKELEESKDMNPNGFWECPFTVGGCYYTFRMADLLTKIKKDKEENKPPKICKIVSQGLPPSDPDYITKIVYLIRHPRAVAKSQERLKRDHIVPEFLQENLPEGWDKEHTPQMYINVTGAACRFFLKYPDIPTTFINYDDLIEEPKETILKIEQFVGEEGSWNEATELINPKLRRSYPQDLDHKLWEDAEEVYKLFNDKDFKGVLAYLSNPSRAINKQQQSYYCLRMNRNVRNMECNQCLNNDVVKKNYIKLAESKGIKWEEYPCAFECASINSGMSVKQSIKENHWSNDKDKKT